jgi:hypothetical protein
VPIFGDLKLIVNPVKTSMMSRFPSTDEALGQGDDDTDKESD